MADKTNLDKQIEATLKANLNSISASEDLIAKTLARLEENKKASVTPMPVKKKRLPVAVISTIAASAIALAGGFFLFTSITSNSKSSESAAAIDAVGKSEEAIFEAASNDTDSEVLAESVDAISVEENDSMEEAFSLSVHNPEKKTTLSSKTYSDVVIYLNTTPLYTEVKNPYYRNNPGMITAPMEKSVDSYNLNPREMDNRILSKMQKNPYLR